MRFLKFRVRSPLRDRQTDRERIGSVRNAIKHAVTSAELELAGLIKRRDAAAASAAFAFDLSDSDYSTRDPADELAITQAENAHLAACNRFLILEQHLSGLRQIAWAFDEKFPLQESTE